MTLAGKAVVSIRAFSRSNRDSAYYTDRPLNIVVAQLHCAVPVHGRARFIEEENHPDGESHYLFRYKHPGKKRMDDDQEPLTNRYLPRKEPIRIGIVAPIHFPSSMNKIGTPTGTAQ